ncbi:MAG: hypothetical protein E6R03_12455 [Hyphomicrobiaceae bacterium]|nr:MAG: hypothetical protein E6R03_12455 [Hyphomicrobiaceae bacterium]
MIPLHISAGIVGAINIIPAARSYIARLTDAVDINWQLAVNDMIAEAQLDGWYSKLDAWWIYANASLDNACKSITGSTYDQTHAGHAPTLEAFRKITGDGSAAYLASSYKFGTSTLASLNDHSMFAWNVRNKSGTSYVAGASAGGTTIGIRPWTGTQAQFFSASASSGNVSVTYGTGLRGLSRDNGTNFIGVVDDTDTTLAVASSALPTNVASTLRLGLGGTYSDLSPVMEMRGKALSADERRSVWHTWGTFLIRIGAVTTLTPPGQTPLGPNHWQASDISSVTTVTKVTMQAAAPDSNSVSYLDYDYFPLNVAASKNIASLVASTWNTTAITAMHFLWGNRNNSRSGLKPNPIYPAPVTSTGVECRMEYSTTALARAADRIAAMYTLGYTFTEIQTYATSVGLSCISGYGSGDVLSTSYLIANANTVFTRTPSVGTAYKTALDKAWIPDARVVDCTTLTAGGILLDCEWQDGRTAADTLAHVIDIADLCAAKSKRLIVYCNAFDAASQIYSNFNATNLWTIHNHAAVELCILLTTDDGDDAATVNASIEAQLDLIRAGGTVNYSKLTFVVSLGPPGNQFTNAAADAIKAKIDLYGIGGAHFFRQNQPQGGMLNEPDTNHNQIIARVLGLPTS